MRYVLILINLSLLGRLFSFWGWTCGVEAVYLFILSFLITLYVEPVQLYDCYTMVVGAYIPLYDPPTPACVMKYVQL